MFISRSIQQKLLKLNAKKKKKREQVQTVPDQVDIRFLDSVSDVVKVQYT